MFLNALQNQQERTCVGASVFVQLKRLRYKCSLLSFSKFLRTTFLQNISRGLLLYLMKQANTSSNNATINSHSQTFFSLWKSQGHVQFNELCLDEESIQFNCYITLCKQQHLQLVVGGIKEAQLVLFLVILRVLVAYFRVQVIWKVVFEEIICKINLNKFVSFLLNLKLDFNIFS